MARLKLSLNQPVSRLTNATWFCQLIRGGAIETFKPLFPVNRDERFCQLIRGGAIETQNTGRRDGQTQLGFCQLIRGGAIETL